MKTFQKQTILFENNSNHIGWLKSLWAIAHKQVSVKEQENFTKIIEMWDFLSREDQRKILRALILVVRTQKNNLVIIKGSEFLKNFDFLKDLEKVSVIEAKQEIIRVSKEIGSLIGFHKEYVLKGSFSKSELLDQLIIQDIIENTVRLQGYLLIASGQSFNQKDLVMEITKLLNLKEDK